MSTFSDAFQEFCAGLADLPGDEFGLRVNGLLPTFSELTPEEGNWAAEPLSQMIAREENPRVSVVGVFGELLCRGVSLWGYLPYYLAALKQFLERGARVEEELKPKLPEGKHFRDLTEEESQSLLAGLPEELRSQSASWFMIDFYLGPAMPIFQQVESVRQLARAMDLSVDWLADNRTGVEWASQLPGFFLPGDEPWADPMPTVEAALSELRRLSASPPEEADSIHKALEPIFAATTFVLPAQYDRVAEELARITAEADPIWAGELAGVCGAFVERGANPEPGVDVLIEGLSRLLDPLVEFVATCRELVTDVEEEGSPVELYGETVLERMPNARPALEAISGYCLGTIAHLARCPSARQRHGENEELLAKLNEVRWDTGNTGFLWKMLQVLDEELVVLVPEHRLGWRVHIDGVADNFQLHALIGGHLVGQLDDDKYPGTVGTHDQPNPEPGIPFSARTTATQLVAPCTGQEPGFSSDLQLWNWTGLQKDGTLPENPTDHHDHWVWNEGVPADIAPFDGTRIVLMGPTNLERNWNGGRIFPFMLAKFGVVETLSREVVGEWLERIADRVGGG